MIHYKMPQDELLVNFFEQSNKDILNLARSHGQWWWKETADAWKKYRLYYGTCPSCGDVFSLTRCTCVNCGESDEYPEDLEGQNDTQ